MLQQKVVDLHKSQWKSNFYNDFSNPEYIHENNGKVNM